MNFINDIGSFAIAHPFICIGTLGFAAIGYAIGRFGGRCYQWLFNPTGTAAKTNTLFNQTILQKKTATSQKSSADYSFKLLDDPNIKQSVKDLFKLVFVDIINEVNLAQVQPLENQLEKINLGLKEFATLHNINLVARGSFHSKNPNDPWQTIKITEPNKTVGEYSQILVDLNDALHEKFEIIGNGGDNCQVLEGVKKHDPQCFIQKGTGTKMDPQLLISLIDIKRIVGLFSEENYIKALKDAYIK